MSTKTLWRMMVPFETTFATAGLRSPNLNIGPACRGCGLSTQSLRPKPLVFEWEPGSDVIGDFTWPNGARVVVKKSVMDTLLKQYGGIHPEPIEMVQDPKLKQPKKLTKRSKPRVWLPYMGPELYELWPDNIVPFLPMSTIIVITQCRVCGRSSRRISGVEVKSHLYDPDRGELVPDLHPRTPGQGLFIAAESVRDTPIFRVEEFSESIFCTDDVKSFVERECFTNIDFLEDGEIL